MRTIIVTLCSLILCTGWASIAYAHSTDASWEATSTPYIIDIGYDPNDFQVGQSARFDFLLHNEKNENAASFDHVWVRIVRGDHTLLATGIREQQAGPTTLLYGFTVPGGYKIETSFRDKKGNDIAAASFPITVTAGSSSVRFLPYGIGVIAFVIGVFTGAIGMRARNHSAAGA
ncbi:hypothetical protein HY971_02120 [Candidatus Kaiserbacteria bacterium]|nr:hypothetical protein [Candidatus Kaiserbacteria bacterium]